MAISHTIKKNHWEKKSEKLLNLANTFNSTLLTVFPNAVKYLDCTDRLPDYVYINDEDKVPAQSNV